MTTIGPTLIITGELASKEDVTIHGRVNGQIRMNEGALLVTPHGAVHAEIEGTRVTIHGKLDGNVLVTERVELAPTSDVTGTLTTPAVVVREGATFNGRIDVDRRSVKDKPRPKSGPVAVAPASKAVGAA
jgi:cytoskeletal protein CcmA (bactofilin family)